jgi:hypothetical protein
VPSNPTNIEKEGAESMAIPMLWKIKVPKQGPCRFSFALEKVKMSKTDGIVVMMLSKEDLYALRKVITAALTPVAVTPINLGK